MRGIKGGFYYFMKRRNSFLHPALDEKEKGRERLVTRKAFVRRSNRSIDPSVDCRWLEGRCNVQYIGILQALIMEEDWTQSRHQQCSASVQCIGEGGMMVRTKPILSPTYM